MNPADASYLGEQSLGASSADSNDIRSIPQTDTSLFDDVQMVREHDRLNAVADRRKRFETVTGAGFVKARENVVSDERRRLGARRIVLDISKPQRQIELVARPFAQMRHRRPLPIGPASFKLGLIIIVETLIQSGKGAARQRCEHLASASHQGVASRSAVVLERAAEQCRSRLQHRPTPGGLHEFGLRIAALLQRGLGANAAFEFLSPTLKPVAFRVAVLFLLPKVFVPALQFRQTCRGSIRIERFHFFDQPCFIDPVGEIGEPKPLPAERLDKVGTLGLTGQQGDSIRTRGQVRRMCRHFLLGFAKESPRLIERSPSRLPQLAHGVTLCLSRPRRNKTLVQEARGRLGRQVGGRWPHR